MHHENATPKLSLVIATTGRIPELKKLLESLSKENSNDFEVILVDQSLPTVCLQVHDLAKIYSTCMSLQYLRDEGKGLSRARNIGLRHVRGMYVGFPDDDCWYSGNVISNVISFFEKRVCFGILSGIYTEPGFNNPKFPDLACELTHKNFIGKTSSVGLFLNKGSIGSLSILFDECIGAGTAMPAGEETDLLLRFLLAGVRGYYEPSLVVYHLIHRDKESTKEDFITIKKAFWYVIGKNYSPLFSEAKLILGCASCVVKGGRYGVRTSLKALLSGYWHGLKARRIN